MDHSSELLSRPDGLWPLDRRIAVSAGEPRRHADTARAEVEQPHPSRKKAQSRLACETDALFWSWALREPRDHLG